MKNSLILLFILSSFSSNLNAQDIKIGDSFDLWKSDFTLLGISSKTNVSTYEYKKPITKSIYGHKAGKFLVGVRNNKIITYSYYLIPEQGEIGVPYSLITRFKQETGFDLTKARGAAPSGFGEVYGAQINNLLISISRVNKEVFGGDRIMVYVSRAY